MAVLLEYLEHDNAIDVLVFLKPVQEMRSKIGHQIVLAMQVHRFVQWLLALRNFGLLGSYSDQLFKSLLIFFLCLHWLRPGNKWEWASLHSFRIAELLLSAAAVPIVVDIWVRHHHLETLQTDGVFILEMNCVFCMLEDWSAFCACVEVVPLLYFIVAEWAWCLFHLFFAQLYCWSLLTMRVKIQTMLKIAALRRYKRKGWRNQTKRWVIEYHAATIITQKDSLFIEEEFSV